MEKMFMPLNKKPIGKIGKRKIAEVAEGSNAIVTTHGNAAEEILFSPKQDPEGRTTSSQQFLLTKPQDPSLSELDLEAVDVFRKQYTDFGKLVSNVVHPWHFLSRYHSFFSISKWGSERECLEMTVDTIF